MARPAIPKAVREAVMNEYNHRCAICGADRPHIHHIDENPENNDPLNLLPLCPNCHLSDQHNPTSHIDVGIIQLFRKHRNPSILTPQFNSLYHKFSYLLDDEIKGSDEALDALRYQLASFVGALEMGSYYGGMLAHLLERRRQIVVGPNPFYGEISAEEFERLAKKNYELDNEQYRVYLTTVRGQVIDLIIDCLHFQHWL